MMKKSLSMNKDRWYFDFGSNIALTIVIYQIIILFSTIAPLITLLGAIFFTIKYLIDKYNICYVYPTENYGESKLVNEIVNLQYISMIFQQISMFGFFALIFSDRFWLSCIVFVILQLFILVIFYSFQDSPFLKKYFLPWLANNIMQMKDVQNMTELYEKKTQEAKDKEAKARS